MLHNDITALLSIKSLQIMLKTINKFTWWLPNTCIWQERRLHYLLFYLIHVLIIELFEIEQLSHFDSLLTVLFQHGCDELRHVFVFYWFIENVKVQLFDWVAMKRIEPFAKYISTNTEFPNIDLSPISFALYYFWREVVRISINSKQRLIFIVLLNWLFKAI